MKKEKKRDNVQVTITDIQAMNILSLIHNYREFLESLESPNAGTKYKLEDLRELAKIFHQALLDPK